jgi:hypothetical protein
MAPLNAFGKLGFKPQKDIFHMDKKRGRITFGVSSINFIDRDTKQHVIYIPAFNISSYGSTEEKAEEMLKYCIDDFCTYLMKLPFKSVITELRKLGWKHDSLHQKEFSSTSIDINGNLRDFNAKDNKVTISKLELAA